MCFYRASNQHNYWLSTLFVPHNVPLEGQSSCFTFHVPFACNWPEVHEVPGVYEGGGHPLGQGEAQVLEMDPHRPRPQPRLLGGSDQVHRELLTLLQLVTQPHLASSGCHDVLELYLLGQAILDFIILLSSPATSSASPCRQGRGCGSSPWRWGRWCWPPCPGWSPPRPRCSHWGWRCPWCWPHPAPPPAHLATAGEWGCLKQVLYFIIVKLGTIEFRP